MAASAIETRSDKAAYWSGHVAAWQRSGLSQGAYCREQSLSQSSLNYWRKRLGTTIGTKDVPAVTIVPVPLPVHTPTEAPLLVHVGEMFRIEIRGDFGSSVLEKLIRTLARL